jgi:hypothetical protein
MLKQRGLLEILYVITSYNIYGVRDAIKEGKSKIF